MSYLDFKQVKIKQKGYVIYAMVGHMKRLSADILALNVMNVVAIILMKLVICNNLSAVLV